MLVSCLFEKAELFARGFIFHPVVFPPPHCFDPTFLAPVRSNIGRAKFADRIFGLRRSASRDLTPPTPTRTDIAHMPDLKGAEGTGRNRAGNTESSKHALGSALSTTILSRHPQLHRSD